MAKIHSEGEYKMPSYNHTELIGNLTRDLSIRFTGEGRLQNRSWETPEGQKRNKVEVVANQVIFLNFKKNQGADGHQERQDAPEVGDQEIPFNGEDA
jgi:single-stranded DNA-binding protein